MSNIQEKIIEEINNSKKIGFITHKDGDGDAFGSMLALEKIVSEMGKETIIFSNERLPFYLDFIKEDIIYNTQENYSEIDILICFDANIIKRFTIPEILEKTKKDNKKIIVIDHHINGELDKVSDIYWRDLTLSSTAEMVYKLLIKMGVNIDKITATLLLFGIETDTLSLQFTNTSPTTFRAVADLLNKGAKLKNVVESAFGSKPIPTIKLLGRAINRMKINENALAYTYLTLKDMQELDLTEQSASGVANFLEQVKEAKVVAVLQERENDIIKVSMRSNNSDINVSTICELFGGGGHSKASGCEISGTIKSVTQKIISAVKKHS